MKAFVASVVVGALVAPAVPVGAMTNLIEVTVGETKVIDVGHAMGWYCDHPELLLVVMSTNGDHNEWSVTGVTEGVTQCRIGTSPGLPNFLLDVHVLPPPPPVGPAS